jgi:hypothetical protein
MATIDSVRVVDDKEGYEILDEAARRYLKMSAKEFLEAWDAGKFSDRVDTPDVMRVASLIPFAQ